jgi:AmiR/NasT family two-component response regulator
MTSALIASTPAPGAPNLSADLESVGIHVVGAADSGILVQEVLRRSPDIVVCYEESVGEGLFASTATLYAAAPRPVVVFTNDVDVDKIERALRSGIHAYEIAGYAVARLRPVIHLAQARFHHEQRQREELTDLTQRFEDRKLLDRAKGILMRARQISEDEAFRALRTASMHSNQRLGQISQHVIDAAHNAQAVNRSGQLRMLSQRLVKLYALIALGINVAEHAASLAQSVSRIDKNLGMLADTLSKATFGDLLDAVLAQWTALKVTLSLPLDVDRLPELDDVAEQVLLRADQLTASLESAGPSTTLHVINVSGRQRMLSQRLAKLSLLAVLSAERAEQMHAEAAATSKAFDDAMTFLLAAPLSTRAIRESLDEAARLWAQLTRAIVNAGQVEGQHAVGAASESLLVVFDRLTDEYERSMQALMG